MNQTPRGVNRTLLVLLGVLLCAAGGHLLLVSLGGSYALGWTRFASLAGGRFQSLLASTTLPGQPGSWLWIVAAVALVVLVLLMVWWMAVQGKGRTGTYAREYYDDGARGMVEIGAGVPEQAIRTALSERHDIVSVNVSVWDSPQGEAGLRIRVLPRQGAAPLRIAEDISALVVALDRALGRGGPVVIHLAAGARARMSRSDRVL
ncbi:hypothetical protein NCCP1664_26200 [Zafaria cholistanensis]|uniref:Alkaline shock response membrane anchor protein AmaP n=1 Tax=Zafaria cholistanensis TaxID=1682741 RepID=A0A5A7NTE5_9MICC|nr:hypothetical protein [Zafaria cholistanensis]GER24125.1 hypothetical protein NCCP1664_26200 [Zafaria cholistanensis]